MRSRSVRLLRQYLAPEWVAAVALLALVLSATAAAIVQPLLLARFIDTARAGATNAALARTAAAFLALAVIGQIVSVAEFYFGTRLALVTTNRLRADLTRHCLGLDLSFHNDHGPGVLIQRIEGDVANLGNFLSRFLLTLVGQLVLLLGVLAMLSTINWRLGVGMAVFSVLVLAVLVGLRNVARPAWARFLQAESDQSEFLAENLAATEDLRSSGATGFTLRRYIEHARSVLHTQRQAMFVGNLVGGLSTVLFTVGTTMALGAAAWLFRRGEATIGTVFLVFTYTRMLTSPIEAINREILDLQTAAAAVGRVSELFDATTAITDGPVDELPFDALALRLDGVEFAYTPDEPVLDGVDVEVRAGNVLGVVGRTGSGKTTIARLFLRFYDVEAGAASVAGRDVRDLRVSTLRDRVGLVSQEVQLFHASARDNLTFFDDRVPEQRIVDVLRELGLGPWLDRLPDGLDTLVEFGGTALSAGEAQLLAFARVFLRDPSVVILDEATSRLDPATERLVERAIDRLLRGRTAVVIAHRLETVLRADEIVVLDDGRIVERGRPDSLRADPDSRFAELLRTGLGADA